MSHEAKKKQHDRPQICVLPNNVLMVRSFAILSRGEQWLISMIIKSPMDSNGKDINVQYWCIKEFKRCNATMLSTAYILYRHWHVLALRADAPRYTVALRGWIRWSWIISQNWSCQLKASFRAYASQINYWHCSKLSCVVNSWKYYLYTIIINIWITLTSSNLLALVLDALVTALDCDGLKKDKLHQIIYDTKSS